MAVTASVLAVSSQFAKLLWMLTPMKDSAPPVKYRISCAPANDCYYWGRDGTLKEHSPT